MVSACDFHGPPQVRVDDIGVHDVLSGQSRSLAVARRKRSRRERGRIIHEVDESGNTRHWATLPEKPRGSYRVQPYAAFDGAHERNY